MARTSIIPRDVFSELPWWKKLKPDEQQTVQQESQALGQALMQHGFSKLAVGEHLGNLQAILEPKRLFVRYLRNFHFSQRSAYRYIAGFQNARTKLPEPILRAAMARGLNMIGDTKEAPLGTYTDVVRRLPPPKTEDPEKISEWIGAVEEKHRERRSHPAAVDEEASDPETMMKECYRFISIRFRRLPNNSRSRANWTKTLAGMLLADLGVGNPQSIDPVAVPEDFRAVRGRPPKAGPEVES